MNHLGIVLKCSFALVDLVMRGEWWAQILFPGSQPALLVHGKYCSGRKGEMEGEKRRLTEVRRLSLDHMDS